MMPRELAPGVISSLRLQRLVRPDVETVNKGLFFWKSVASTYTSTCYGRRDIRRMKQHASGLHIWPAPIDGLKAKEDLSGTCFRVGARSRRFAKI